MFQSIGNVALRTAEKSGIAYGDQPPYPCSLPLQSIEDASDVDHVESILGYTFESILDMLDDNLPKLNASVTDAKLNKPWKSVGYKDKAPGGDLVLQSRPHVGAYNLARVTVSFHKVHPATILTCMMAQDLSVRRSYSGNLCEYEVLARNPRMPSSIVQQPGDDDVHLPELAELGIRDWHIEYNQYYAPPPVASRDMIYLVEKRYVPETQRYYIYGTSVDYAPAASRKASGSRKCVRGYVMFGWEFKIVGESTKARYVSCMNPNGWTPTFMVGWMKSEIAKEFVHSRALLYKETPRPDVPDMSAISTGTAEQNHRIRQLHVSDNVLPASSTETAAVPCALVEANLNPLVSGGAVVGGVADDELPVASHTTSPPQPQPRGDSFYSVASDSDFEDMKSSFAFSRQTTLNVNSFVTPPQLKATGVSPVRVGMASEDARLLQDDEEEMLLC